MADSLNKALGGGRPAALDINEKPGGPKVIGETTPQLATEKATENKNESDTEKINLENITIKELKAKLDNYAAENNIQNTMVSSVEERGLIVSVKDTLLFNSGSAVVTANAHELLEKISKFMLDVPNYIRIEGHTDNVPINTQQFQSNWELSVLRATNVLQLMINEGHISPNRLSAAGYGEFRPISSNTDTEGHARNRRVDIVILKTKYDIIEPGEQSGINP